MKKPMETKLVCTVLSGQTSNKERAHEIAHTFKDCPYVYFMATVKNHVFAVMFLTEKRANTWIENQTKNPKIIFGLEQAAVTIANNVQYPRQLKLRLPKKPQEETPCGLNCTQCLAYQKCTGCPATNYYKENRV